MALSGKLKKQKLKADDACKLLDKIPVYKILAINDMNRFRLFFQNI